VTPATEADLAIMTEQLGRPVRDVVGVAARTLDPVLVAAISRLEAAGLMREWSELVAPEGPFAAQYAEAHAAYLADRTAVGEVPELAGTSAGGMPTRVKCLHALAGHALAAGPGVNPIGDLALAEAAAAEPAVRALVGPWQPPVPR
jgi:uncharacterized protein